MAATVRFRKSSGFDSEYPGLSFGLALIAAEANPENPPGFDSHKKQLLRRMRKRETLAGITERIGRYDLFFQEFGYPCPLPGHLKRTVNSGFPRYNLMVDAHFLAEMCAGILVAVADFDRFDGGLTLDVATEGEKWTAMGGRELSTRPGEIVLRDERDIVCVLCQGADEKTRVGPETRNVLLYAYAVPGVAAEHIEAGLTVGAEAVAEFGPGRTDYLRVH